jgi:hypothetical protein
VKKTLTRFVLAIVLVLSLVALNIAPVLASDNGVVTLDKTSLVALGVASVAIVGVAVVALSHKARRFVRGVLLMPLTLVGMAITDGTFKQGLSISQILHALGKWGPLKYLPSIEYCGITADVTGQTTEVLRICFVAVSKCYVKSAYLISAAALAASDTNYLTITLKNLTDTTSLAATAKTTKSTGGAAIAVNTAWAITVDQHNTLDAGDVLELSLTPSTNSVANDLTEVKVVLGISYDEDDYIA